MPDYGNINSYDTCPDALKLPRQEKEIKEGSYEKEMEKDMAAEMLCCSAGRGVGDPSAGYRHHH